MLDHAKASVYLAQEDIFSKIPLPIVPDIQQKFNLGDSAALPALVKAILRGVQIKIVQTDQVGDGADGYGMMDAQEAQAYIIESLLKEARKQGVKPTDGQSLTQYLCSMFEIAPWRFTASERLWGDNKRKIGSHPKIIIVDRAVFYLGSHNFYPASLQEFGVIVTDDGVTRELLTNYWDKLWSASAPDRIGCDRPDQELLPKPGMFGKSR
jgi:phosphatidylserine/phosphatidylglycerophosphate/cardiolipin synthase-like enzyme